MPGQNQRQRPKTNPVEQIKSESQFLAGSIAEELHSDAEQFGKDSLQLLKFHGTYQQDDRDRRIELRKLGRDKAYSMMIRTRIPGGVMTADQLLAHLDLCDLLGNSTMKITTRQTIQLHGIVKRDLKRTIALINEMGLSTLAACGDVNRNVMCCPAKRLSPVRDAINDLTKRLAEELAPRTRAYQDLWLQDVGTGEQMRAVRGDLKDKQAGAVSESVTETVVASKTDATAGDQVAEPLYGPTYLPRKFKIGITLPEDNCVDVYTQDLGFIAVVREERLLGFNVIVGGGMGCTPSVKETFPALAQRMAFCTPEQAIDVAKAVMIVQRDHGNRENRKLARMKYLVHRWGLDRFRSQVQTVLGYELPDCTEEDVHGVDDHMGWQAQHDGLWSYGLNIENGRIIDGKQLNLKAALRRLAELLQTEIRLTANQSLIFCDIPSEKRGQINKLLQECGVVSSEATSLVRREALACVALPSCGLAVTEGERRLPGVVDRLELVLEDLELGAEKFTIRMTGCPNGCARPYTADIALVGKARDQYTLFLGGTRLGTRLAYIYQEKLPKDEIIPLLGKMFNVYRQQRLVGESVGDFFHRVGQPALQAAVEKSSYQVPEGLNQL